MKITLTKTNNTEYNTIYNLDNKSVKFYNEHNTESDYEMNAKDFYTLVIAAAQKYKEVGGLDGFER